MTRTAWGFVVSFSMLVSSSLGCGAVNLGRETGEQPLNGPTALSPNGNPPTTADGGGPGTPQTLPPDAGIACPPAGRHARYVGNSDTDPAICATIHFTCEAEESPFTDASCGCGCQCRPPTDPKMHYIADSYADLSICMRIDFGCNPGQKLFSSDCGCGCIDVP